MTHIHPSAIVSPMATVGDNVHIGPFCVVEDDVAIGNGTSLLSHVVLANGARIGSDVRLHPGAVIGTAPQDLKYAGEPTTAVVGDRTVIRECVTVNRGTTATETTRVGSDCLLMAYAHVAHDCQVGDHVIMANSVQLGGHVHVDDWAIIGGLTGVHQFVRIGAHCMVAASSMATQDIPPYTLVGRTPLGVEGLNLVGMRRRGFTAEEIDAIKHFFEVLYRKGLNVSDALQAYRAQTSEVTPRVQAAINFIESSKRGICRMRHA